MKASLISSALSLSLLASLAFAAPSEPTQSGVSGVLNTPTGTNTSLAGLAQNNAQSGVSQKSILLAQNDTQSGANAQDSADSGITPPPRKMTRTNAR